MSPAVTYYWESVFREAAGDVKVTFLSQDGFHHGWKSDLEDRLKELKTARFIGSNPWYKDLLDEIKGPFDNMRYLYRSCGPDDGGALRLFNKIEDNVKKESLIILFSNRA